MHTDAEIFRLPLQRMPRAARELIELLNLTPQNDVCSAALEEIRQLRMADTRRLIDLVNLAEAATGVLALLDRPDVELTLKDHVSDAEHKELNQIFNQRFALLRKRVREAPPTPWVK